MPLIEKLSARRHKSRFVRHRVTGIAYRNRTAIGTDLRFIHESAHSATAGSGARMPFDAGRRPFGDRLVENY